MFARVDSLLVGYSLIIINCQLDNMGFIRDSAEAEQAQLYNLVHY